MAAGKHTLRSGKLHRTERPKDGRRIRTVFRPGDRFDATEGELRSFGDCIVTWAAYLSLTRDAVDEVEGEDTKPTDKPTRKRKSRAKTAKKPEPEPDDDSEPEGEPEPEPIE